MDFNHDGRIDKLDLLILAQFWLQDNPTLDIAPLSTPDGIINLHEFSLLTQPYLTRPN